MKDALVRALRTFFQSLIGAFLATSFLSTVANSSSLDADALKRAGISSLAAAVIALLSFVQNYLEDVTGKTALK